MNAGTVDGVAGGEIIGTVENDIGTGDQGAERFAGQALLQRDDIDFRIDGAQRLAARLGLGHADPCLGVDDLSLQVGEVDRVVVNQRDLSDAGRGKIKRRRRTQTTSTDDQCVRGQNIRLTFDAEFVEQDVTAVTEKLLVRHL